MDTLFMTERSLLYCLPAGVLNPSEAVDHLRNIARLFLEGVHTLAFQGDQPQALANKLIKDAIALYDMAILRQQHILSYACTPTISANGSINDSPLPFRDEQFAQEIASGARCAKLWLDRRTTRPLWWQLAEARRDYPEGNQRDAFEIGFLRHLQQQLIRTRYQQFRKPTA